MKEKEEGIYDDCNWKNKNKAYQINDGSWINAAHIMLSDSIMKKQQDLMFHDFLELGQVNIDFHAAQARENLLKKQVSSIYHAEHPISPSECFKKSTPFEDWQEGLEWGEQGDIIQP